jgi:hypothetical protein
MLGRAWSFLGGSAPTAAILIETVTPVKTGQREGVCRVKAFTGNTVLQDSSGKIEKDDVFSLRTMLIFFTIAVLCFFLTPLYRCCMVCLRGPNHGNDKLGTPVIAQGTPIITSASFIVSGDKEGKEDVSVPMSPLRQTGQDVDDIPVLPPASPVNGSSANIVSHPNAVSPDAAQPTEEEQEEDNNVEVAPPPTAEESPLPPQVQPANMQVQGRSRWSRKVKAPEGAKKFGPRASEGSVDKPDHNQHMGLSPADVANAATFGAAVMAGGVAGGIAGGVLAGS